MIDDPALATAVRREGLSCGRLAEVAEQNAIDAQLQCAASLESALASGGARGGAAGGGERRTSSERQSVSVTLGALNEETGLAQADDPDGVTASARVGERFCRVFADAGFETRYMYFQVDDDFIHATRTPVDVTVEFFAPGVEFFAPGAGSLGLEYDSVDGPWTDGGRVELTDASAWASHTFHLADAWFANRQQDRFDFRFGVPATPGGPPSLCVRRVVVTRSAPVLRLRLSTTSDRLDAEPANATLISGATIIEPAQLPQRWAATREALHLEQPMADAEGGSVIELVVHLRLAPDALTRGVGFDVQKGGPGSARVQFFAVAGESARLLKTVTIEGTAGEGIDAPRRIGVSAAELRHAFPEFAGQPAGAIPSATVAPVSTPAPSPTPAPTPAAATPPAGSGESCEGAVLRVESWDYPKQLSGRTAALTVDIGYLLPVGTAVESLAVVLFVDAEPVLFSDILAAFPDATLPTARDPSTARLTPFVLLLTDGGGGMIADGVARMLTYSDTLPRGQSWNDDSRYAIRWSELIDTPFRLREPPMVRIIFESEGQRWFYNTQGTCRAE